MAHHTELVGILNVTPDSFSDGGLYDNPDKAVAQTTALFNDGAAIVDVGAESTRPGATPLTVDEEWNRLKRILNEIIPGYTDAISLDTHHAETVRRAAQIGSIIINDVTAFNDPEMREVAAYFGFRCIVSHLPGSVGQDIQRAHREKAVDGVEQVYDELLTRRDELIAAGVHSGSIILDPGIGFGKTETVNWALLAFASRVPEHNVMIGYSRKRFLGEDRMDLAPNLEAARIAVEAGAKYLRVHDVAGHYSSLGSRGQL